MHNVYLCIVVADKEYRLDAGIWKSSETHGGEDVGIYARGPMAHLFHGKYRDKWLWSGRTVNPATITTVYVLSRKL